MLGTASPTPMEASEYDAIEAAFRETERGRWFLVEHARRNRGADTDTLLQAIGRLESAVVGEREAEGFGRLRGDLMEMAEAIARTKAEIAALSTPDQDQSRLTLASEALDAIVRATERATTDILGAAEDVQETAWTLREQGIDLALCDELDRRATQIYTACSFQDLTAQRTSRIVHTLRYLEDRIASMISIWGDRLDAIPGAPDGATARIPVEAAPEPLDQTDVDRFLDMDPGAPTPEHGAGANRRASAAELALASDDIGWADPVDEFAETPDVVSGSEDSPGDTPVSADADLAHTSIDDPASEMAPIVEEIEHEPAPVDAAEPEHLASAAPSTEPTEPVDETPFAFDTAEPAAAESSAPTGAKPARRAVSKKAAKAPTEDLSIAFADLDRLSIEEKIALFS